MLQVLAPSLPGQAGLVRLEAFAAPGIPVPDTLTAGLTMPSAGDPAGTAPKDLTLWLVERGPLSATWLGAFAAGAECPPGTGEVTLDFTPGDLWNLSWEPREPRFLRKAFRIGPQAFRSETIPMNAVMTGIRTRDDPEKTRQLKTYGDLLASARGDNRFAGLWPASGSPFAPAVESHRRTSFFGDARTYVYPSGYRERSVHWGVDYGIPSGTPVCAPAPGRVVMSENRITTGNTVILEHLPGMYSICMHLDRRVVERGGVVERGDLLGYSGMTGFATGPHLHWELRIRNVAVDPESLFRPVP